MRDDDEAETQNTEHQRPQIPCLDHPDRKAVAWFHTFKTDVFVCGEDLAKYFGREYPAYLMDGRKILTVVKGAPIPDPAAPRRTPRGWKNWR